ncbi:cytochrome P450 [Hyaloraphidium curvatum]|nr:cytochrome P450 [Hyaloraphidium curvatum]
MSAEAASWLALPSATTFLLVAAVALLAYELIRRTWFSFDDDLPLLMGLPFLNRPPADRIRDMHDFEKELTWKLKTPVYRTMSYLKPWTRSVLIGDPAILKEIYVGAAGGWEKFDRGHPYQDSMQHHAGGLILIKNGQRWREAREALGNKTFSSTTMRTYVPILREQFTIMLEQIERRLRESGKDTVDLQDIYSNMTFDMICRLVFGESVHAQTSPEGAAYLHAWDGVLGLANILSLLHSLVDKWVWKLFPKIYNKFNTDLTKIQSLVDDNVQRRKRGEDLDRVSILDDLFRNEKAPAWLKEDANVKQQLITLLFAGHDTTAALLSFLTYELAAHPDWQRRVREEVVEAFGTDTSELITNLDKLEAMPVLNACIKETLRMYPSAPFGAGRVMNTDYLFKYTDPLTGKPRQIDLRKGDSIRPSMYIAQMYQPFWDPAYGPVTEWNPDRFLKDPNGGAISMYCYAPFGNGARRCAGERLALSEARLTISELARRYEWRMQDGFKFAVLMTGTIKARDGVKVVMKKLQR